MLKDKFNQIYSDPNFTPREKPSDVVTKINKYLKGGSVLDLGAGDGRNSLYLAKQGFSVTAVDFSAVAMAKLENLAEEKNLKITTVVSDVTSLTIKDSYEAILVIQLFHNLTKPEVLNLIKKIKSQTKQGGLNILEFITPDSDFYDVNWDSGHFYSSKEEILELYSGWQLLESENRNWEASHSKFKDGRPMWNTSEALILKKPL